MFAVFLTLAISALDYGDKGANWEKVEKDEFLDIGGVTVGNHLCYFSHTKAFTGMPACGATVGTDGEVTEHSDKASIIDGTVQCTSGSVRVCANMTEFTNGCTGPELSAVVGHEILLKVTNLKQGFLNVVECSGAGAVALASVSLEFKPHSGMAFYFCWIFVVLTVLLALLIVAAYFHARGRFEMAGGVHNWCVEHKWIVLAGLVASAVIAAVLASSATDDEDVEIGIMALSGVAIVLSVVLTMQIHGDNATAGVQDLGEDDAFMPRVSRVSRVPRQTANRQMRVLQTRV